MKIRQVAGGIIFNNKETPNNKELLLVKNDRHFSKTSDWSTPGGVIDKGETILEGLTREVLEETGISVHSWEGPLYSVQVDFLDRGFFLEVQAFQASLWDGDLILEDPDDIVTDAIFCNLEKQLELLTVSPVWVREPLLKWQEGSSKEALRFEYEVTGYGFDDFKVKRRV